jgi:hypothetical protein
MLDLETLIRDWSGDEASYQFTCEAGTILLQFINHFLPGHSWLKFNSIWLISG